jgi:hypothetical protein
MCGTGSSLLTCRCCHSSTAPAAIVVVQGVITLRHGAEAAHFVDVSDRALLFTRFNLLLNSLHHNAEVHMLLIPLISCSIATKCLISMMLGTAQCRAH